MNTLLFLGVFSSAHAATMCTNIFTSGVARPTGYGAAYNLFSTAKELLVKIASCADTSATVTMGNGNASTHIYNQGYYTGSASGTIPLIAGNTSRYYVDYTCQQINGAWKCNCKDTDCITNLWQLQSVNKTTTTDGGSEGTIGGGGRGSQGGLEQGVYESIPLSGNYKPHLDQIAAGGFRVVLNYQIPDSPTDNIDQLTAYADYAQSKGLKVIWSVKDSRWWDGTYSFASITTMVNALKNHPATWGWYVADDDANNNPSKIVAAANNIKAADPNHPRLTYAGALRRGDQQPLEPANTHIGMGLYPIGQFAQTDKSPYAPGTEAYNNSQGRIEETADWAASKGKPMVAVLQANDVVACYPFMAQWYENSHWPSAAEYTALRDQFLNTAKAKGVAVPLILWYSYFDVMDNKPSAWNTLIQGAFAPLK